MNLEEPTAPPPKPDPQLELYLDEFARHQEEVQAHLRGRVSGTSPIPPTYLPPSSYWTSAEKDLFFHGLTIYSRLRPDLIAEHIKTKNIFDVCLYLDCLETGASQAGPVSEDEFNGEDMPRSLTEPAMDVSEGWIRHEETMAASLNAHASCPWTLGTEARPQCVCPGVTPAKQERNQDGTPAKRRKISGKEFLAHSDFGSLFAVESIIKDEERRLDPEQNLFDIVVNPDDVDGAEQPLEASRPGSGSPQVEEENSSVPAGSSEPQDAQERAAQRRVRKRLYMRKKRAEQTGREAALHTAKLRPGRPSHRRNQKDKTDGKESESEEEPTTPPQEASDDDSPTQSQVNAEEDEEEAAVEEEERKGGGLNKGYRVKEVLLEDGLDAEALCNMNLDLFHLTTLSRVLKLFKKFEFDGPAESGHTSSISIDTVQLLTTVVKEFVSELVRRAIISKEQEVRLKQSIQIWKYDKYEISGENLRECLKSLGLDHLNRANYFVRENCDLRQRPSVTEDYADADGAESAPLAQSDMPTHGTGYTLPESMKWCSLPLYRKLYPSDELMPKTNADDKKLYTKEMREDDRWDLVDVAKSKTYEDALWTTYRSKTDPPVI